MVLNLVQVLMSVQLQQVMLTVVQIVIGNSYIIHQQNLLLQVGIKHLLHGIVR